MTATFSEIFEVSTTVSGPAPVDTLSAGGWQANVAVDAIPTTGDSVKVGFYQAIGTGRSSLIRSCGGSSCSRSRRLFRRELVVV